MKTKTVYICSECGNEFLRWSGRCTNCGAWNSLIEETISTSKSQKKISKTKYTEPILIKDIPDNDCERIITGIEELDRTLGGGIVQGSLILIGGDPGIGKSTIMLEMCSKMINKKSLYVTGEESLSQIKQRARRIVDLESNLFILAENNLDSIMQSIEHFSPEVVVIDSIQSVRTDTIEASAGSVAQLRECSQILMEYAKRTNIAIFIIGHVTKDGMIAGPKLLEHIVDTVLRFEGEKNYSFRLLRSIKNRFGSTNEIGIFEMTDKGLREIKNPSELFLNKNHIGESGIATASLIEGTLPIIIEVQALVSSTSYGTPQRTTNGYDHKRLQMILAVLEKRLGLKFSQCDTFVNVTGGFSINDTAIDLAVATALVSSFNDIPIDYDTVFVGEIGLTGEVRSISQLKKRISEAEKLGFKKIVVPTITGDNSLSDFDIEIVSVNKISHSFAEIFKK